MRLTVILPGTFLAWALLVSPALAQPSQADVEAAKKTAVQAANGADRIGEGVYRRHLQNRLFKPTSKHWPTPSSCPRPPDPERALAPLGR
jgi:hypothetical protein